MLLTALFYELYSIAVTTSSLLSRTGCLGSTVGSHPPPPPRPEPIDITRIDLPPVVDVDEQGACTRLVNPNGTGCIGTSTGLQAGSFFQDSKHIVATVRFAGAPSPPHADSIYDGQQVVILKTDGDVFESGSPWKCITCGLPHVNAIGLPSDPTYDYPQAFADGRRVLAGSFIIECNSSQFFDAKCLPSNTHIYPIRLENKKDGSGPGAAIRELRLHPDNVHIGFNVFEFSSGTLGQFAYTGRLAFNGTPASGDPRYGLQYVNILYDPVRQPLQVHDDELVFDRGAITIGELRGFSGTGAEVLYIGYPTESCNIDVYAANFKTGKVLRLTTHPGYVDPVHMSADDGSVVIMDTRGSNRTEFIAGLRGIPPIVDQITTVACASVRNNGPRRFFRPILLDRYGDRGDYYGQEVNSASYGTPGSGEIDDPEWNGMADPWFSSDGTRIVYAQAKTVPPACGGDNPLPCYNSTEPGGRTKRLIVAHLTSRTPLKPRKVEVLSDSIPWAVPYFPGKPPPVRPRLPDGNYIMHGGFSGFASVHARGKSANQGINAIEVTYHGFSDEGLGTLRGTQDVSLRVEGLTLNKLDWYSDLEYTGLESNSSQKTSEDGFHMSIDAMVNKFEANGTLATTVDGIEYTQPRNGQ